MTASPETASTLEVLYERREQRSFEQRLRVPGDLPCLEGHFPGLPVLPGLAQLSWAAEAGTLLTAAVFYGDTRMRTAADPTLIVLAVAGLLEIKRMYAARNSTPSASSG